MRIPLNGLTQGLRTCHHRGPASQYLDDHAAFAGEISVRAELRREAGMLHLELWVELPGHFICDRCAQSFDRQHQGHDDFFFSFAGSPAEEKDPDVPTIPKGAAEIDVSQEIRDLVILSLPFQLICSPDCKGLCPNCGANLNIEECRCEEGPVDPRWEALRKLK